MDRLRINRPEVSVKGGIRAFPESREVQPSGVSLDRFQSLFLRGHALVETDIRRSNLRRKTVPFCISGQKFFNPTFG